MEEFNKKGFPIVKLHDDNFEIKAIDYWEFRTFKYSEIVKIDYYHNTEKWWGFIRGMSSRFEPHKLKIIKANGADWIYNSPSEYSKEFAIVLREIVKRCGLDQKIKSY